MSNDKQPNMNGFNEYKRVILSKIDDLKSGQKDHAEKLDELKVMVIERFAKMETSIAIIKTKVAFIGIIAGGVMSIAINIGIKVFS